MSSGYVPRIADQYIAELLAEFPALLLVGPRASGKTTTAARQARSIIRLDQPREAALVEADPDAALRGRAEPVLIDEWQLVPSVLGAIKRAVDAEPRAGRFIVTGSVRGRLDSPTWPGTGRLIRVDMGVLTMREIAGDDDLGRPPFVTRLADGDLTDLRVLAEPLDLRDYLDLALTGGFPEMVGRSEQAQAAGPRAQAIRRRSGSRRRRAAAHRRCGAA